MAGNENLYLVVLTDDGFRPTWQTNSKRRAEAASRTQNANPDGYKSTVAVVPGWGKVEDGPAGDEA